MASATCCAVRTACAVAVVVSALLWLGWRAERAEPLCLLPGLRGHFDRNEVPHPVREPEDVARLVEYIVRAEEAVTITPGNLKEHFKEKEVVVDGETGYLVPFDQDPVTSFPYDPDRFARDLAAKLGDLLADPPKRRRFGVAGRKRAEENFSWTRIGDQTIDLYQALIEARKRSKA